MIFFFFLQETSHEVGRTNRICGIIYGDLLSFEMVILYEKIHNLTLFLFSEPEQMIPEQYCVLICRCNDIYILGYVFCDQCLLL